MLISNARLSRKTGRELDRMNPLSRRSRLSHASALIAGLVVGVSGLLSGCSGESNSSENADVPVPVAPALDESPSASETAVSEPSAKGGFQKQFDGIRFTVPDGWREEELTDQQRGFIDARFLIPTSQGELQLTCSSVGGGIQANIDRWIGQFELVPGDEPTIEPMMIAGLEATWVDIRGTFRSGFGANIDVQEGTRMLGVAIPLTPRDFYLKLTGPREQVAEVLDDVREFAQSAQLGAR